MNTTKLELVIGMLALLVISCGRKEDFVGSANDVFTGAPIANLKIGVTHEHVANIGGSIEDLGDATTGSDGKALLDFRCKRSNDKDIYFLDLVGADSRILLLDLIGPGPIVPVQDTVPILAEYYTRMRFGTVPRAKITKGKSGYTEIKLASLSRIKIKINNTGIKNSSDGVWELKFIRGVDTLFFPDPAVTDTFSVNYFFRFFPSDGRVRVNYRTSNELGSNYHFDTIYVAPFAKTIYQINY